MRLDFRILDWIGAHKALIGAVIGSVVVGLAHLGAQLPPPWDQIATAVAITLAALSGGPQPPLPPPPPPPRDDRRSRAARGRAGPFPPAGY